MLVDVTRMDIYVDGDIPEADIEIAMKVLRTLETISVMKRANKTARLFHYTHAIIVRTCIKHNEEEIAKHADDYEADHASPDPDFQT